MKAFETFEHLRSQAIDSLNLTLHEYRHRKTGAMHYHMQADDPHNVFMVALRTMPMDSTGVAHILEHTVLCGSEKYPVRDPFFMMTRRSLNTFMNAFTSSDWTAYPFASENKKDFNNLLNVYLDAVFFPAIDELDFKQEGHRLEFAEMTNPDSALEFKGVVFNEMKGAMSSPVSTLWQTFTRELYPSVTYHYNSGGEPADIPDLTWEQLKAFHAKHYHPSNATFMTYGDIPAAQHQAIFEANALARFEYLDAKVWVPLEQRYTAPKVVQEAYALDEEDLSGKTHVVLGWLLGESTDLDALLKWHLFSSVLLENSASPLRHALETTELGQAPSPLCGLEDANREMLFMAGLEGSEAEQAEAAEALIMGVIEQVAKEGVPQAQVEAVLHQLELHQREITGDHYPFGLSLMLKGLSAPIHGSDMFALMDLDAGLEKLRAAIADADFIPAMARELLANPHRVRLVMTPDNTLNEQKKQAEIEKLKAIRAGLSEADVAQIIAQAQALEARQAQEDDPEVLPKVTLEDVPPTIKEPAPEAPIKAGVTAYKAGTNGLIYQQLIVDMPALSPDEIALLPYLGLMPELGSGGRDYLETQVLQSAVSGGIGAGQRLRADKADPQGVSAKFVVSGKGLKRNAAQVQKLIEETLFTTRFDELDRIEELVTQMRFAAEQRVTGSGHALAMGAAAQKASALSALNFQWAGLAGLKGLKALDDSLKGNKDALADFAHRLAALRDKLLGGKAQWLLVADGDDVSDLASQLVVPASTGTDAFALAPVSGLIQQAWTTSTQVNFVAQSHAAVPSSHEDAAALTVVAPYLRNGFLHTAVREKGGAYGGGASFDAETASLRFFSYRDPRLSETWKDFERSVDWLLNLSGNAKDQRQLEEAIIGVVGRMDQPGSPAGEAKKAFYANLFGRDLVYRQAYRQRILNVSFEDLQRVAQNYLTGEKSRAVITSAKEGEKLGGEGFEVVGL